MAESKPKLPLRKRILIPIKKWGKRLALATILFHGATQLNYWRNDISNAVNPSSIRREFYDQFGIPVRGWKADIEEKPETVLEIAEVVAREKQDNGFNLNYLRVESNNYLKRGVIDQLEDIITTGYGGWYFSKRIGLTNHFDAQTTHHEIKHAKTFAVAKEHPEFLQKWAEFAKDENGNSLYRGNLIYFLQRVRGIKKLVKDKNSLLENQRLGFVSDYARSNIYEDIAELCSAAEYFPAGLDLYVFGSKG